jgi:hypothetical protein
MTIYLLRTIGIMIAIIVIAVVLACLIITGEE